MLIQLQDVLSADTAKQFCATLQDDEAWTDGALTAAGQARRVKHNRQIGERHPKGQEILRTVRQALEQHAIFKAAACPRQLVRVMLSRYDTGMAYGTHIDAPVIDGVRTDLSFTLFLSEPHTYEGGSLDIDLGGSKEVVKLPAGSMVLYPTRYLHQVTPVTSGTRLAAVGWVRSYVRDESRRDIIFNLEMAMRELQANVDSPALARLRSVRANLLREWVED